MSDWNTLHLFDSNRFYENIAPRILNGELIEKYIKSDLYLLMRRTKKIKNEKELIELIQNFIANYDISLRFHTQLRAIEKRKKKPEEKYNEFIKKRYQDINDFHKKHSVEIDHYTNLLQLIMFSECAQFNPHLILGRRFFTNAVKTLAGSIAEECCNKITNMETGGIGYTDSGYIINWLNQEELKLLWMDIDNISPREITSNQYVHDLKGWIKIALKNDLGFISVSNVRESILNSISHPELNVTIDLTKEKLKSVIEYK